MGMCVSEATYGIICFLVPPTIYTSPKKKMPTESALCRHDITIRDFNFKNIYKEVAVYLLTSFKHIASIQICICT